MLVIKPFLDVITKNAPARVGMLIQPARMTVGQALEQSLPKKIQTLTPELLPGQRIHMLG